MPRLLYIGQVPNDGTGSPVILLRHLTRLNSAGWEISVLPEWGDKTEPCEARGWQLRTLPHRQAWWPPLPIKYELCRRLAVQLWARWLEKNLHPRPDAILCYLAWHSDLFCEIACAYGRRAGIPVTCIIHDDATDFESARGQETKLRRRQARILRHNHRNWFVSPEQAAAMAPTKANQQILAPIPEGLHTPGPKWKPAFQDKPALYYAGHLWPAQAKLLARLAPEIQKAGAELVIIGRTNAEVDSMVAQGLARHLPLFPSNREALQHLQTQAAGLIVSYTSDTAELPWTRTSMPSKLIEYSFLGIPIALVAPEDTAVMRWARRQHLASAFHPADTAGLCAWTDKLKQEATWHELAKEWAGYSAGEWSPERIQASLEQGLLS